MTHRVTVKTNYSCKKLFIEKAKHDFLRYFLSHDSCDEKLFLPVFLFTHFCV